VKEEAVSFGNVGSLVGIVTPSIQKDSIHAKTAVLFLNAGIVHRVGAGRVYVKMARALASLGFLTLRFDFSGIGDSAVRSDDLSFEKSAIAETQNAMDFLETTKGIESFILLGGCSGARIAFNTASCDARVIGALLINFPSREEDDAAKFPDAAHRSAFFYYRKSALFSLRSWWRLASGQAHYGQLVRALWCAFQGQIAVEEKACPQVRQFRSDLKALIDRHLHLAFICSEGDHRLDDLRVAGGKELRRLCSDRKLVLEIVKRSDHTFSSLHDQEQLLKVILRRASTMLQIDDRRATSLPMADDSRVLSHEFQS
jgi:pimeloyl-ACP methyl ester carboxylesterase